MRVEVLNSPLVPARSLLLAIHEASEWLSSNMIPAPDESYQCAISLGEATPDFAEFAIAGD